MSRIVKILKHTSMSLSAELQRYVISLKKMLYSQSGIDPMITAEGCAGSSFLCSKSSLNLIFILASSADLAYNKNRFLFSTRVGFKPFLSATEGRRSGSKNKAVISNDFSSAQRNKDKTYLDLIKMHA